MPLTARYDGYADTGLVIERIAELGDRPVPIILGIRARKPGRAAT